MYATSILITQANPMSVNITRLVIPHTHYQIYYNKNNLSAYLPLLLLVTLIPRPCPILSLFLFPCSFFSSKLLLIICLKYNYIPFVFVFFPLADKSFICYNYLYGIISITNSIIIIGIQYANPFFLN